MMIILRKLYSKIFIKIPTFYFSIISGIPYDSSHSISGKIRIIKRLFYYPNFKNRGKLKEGFFAETTKYDPHSPYSASKASSDHFVRAFHDTYGLPIVISNCSNNYGSYQFPEKLIPLFINNIINNKSLPV